MPMVSMARSLAMRLSVESVALDGGDASDLLQPADHALDGVAPAVGVAVEGRQARLVLACRDHGSDAATTDPPAGLL